MGKMNINTFLKNFDAGKYSDKSDDVQVEAGWFDWFCTAKALRNKTYFLTSRMRRLMPSSRINPETMYVFFKNNAPMVGGTYDDFRICSLEPEKVLYTVIPRNMKGLAELWSHENEFREAIIIGTWRDVKRYFRRGSMPLKKIMNALPTENQHYDALNYEMSFKPRMLRPVLKE